jgi:hypothetical protein
MFTREKLLTLGLIGFLLFAVVGVVGYFFVWSPIETMTAEADKLSIENSDKQLKLAQITKDMPRLKTAIRRSLPANIEVARPEYDAAINRVLREAKVPAASISVKPKPVDSKNAPELAPKKPAYNRIALEVNLKKVSMATLTEVLNRYYRLNLLHQITSFTFKKSEENARDGSTRTFGSTTLVADKPDLDVTFVTEAIILEGAENRRSLLPVSLGFGALGGGAGFQTLMQSSEPARGLTPMQLARQLASNDRDYSLLLVKDFFHGPPPPIPPAPVPEIPPPKEDTSAFIRITGLGRNSDGSGTAVIEDIASKQEYLIDVKWQDSKLTTEVVKYYFTPKGVRKSYEGEPDLDISESSSSTARKFRIIGITDDGLVVADKDGSKTAPAGGTRKAKETKISETAPMPTAIEGAPAVVNEKVYVWKPGQSLKELKEITGPEKTKAIRIASGLPETPDK